MKVDRGAVLAGAVLAGVVAALAILVAQGVRSLTGTNANAALYLVLLGGHVAGGRVAGLRRPDAPLTHGALAALAAYVVVLVVVTAVRVALGHALAPAAAFVFNGLMAASAGIFGGYLASRRPAARP